MLEDTYNVLPTAGFSTVKLRHKGFNVSIYDLGGGPQIRDIWPRYFSDVSIFWKILLYYVSKQNLKSNG